MDFNQPGLLKQCSRIVLVLFFCSSLFVGLVGSFIQRDSMPDFRETRGLAKLPVVNNLKSLNDFSTSITKFSADNFGLRKQLLSVYFKFRLKFLKSDLGLPGIIARSDWLFYDGEVSSFRHQDLLTPVIANRIRKNLDAWCEYAHRHDAELVFFVGPNKSTIYPEKMPSYFKAINLPSILDQVNALDFSCRFIKVDLRDTLIKNRNELLYYKWGTHWNDRGAQFSWNKIRDEVSDKLPKLRWPLISSSVSYRPARPLEDSMWQWFGQADPEVVMLPNILLVDAKVSNQSLNKPVKILAFGDSFLQFMLPTLGIVADSYSYWELQPGEKFSNRPEDVEKNAWAIRVPPKQSKIEVMDKLKPNLVLLEVVERNILTLADLHLPDSAIISDDENALFYLTDENWVNGIARHWPGFFVPNNPEMIKQYAVGKIIRFADGQERQIVSIEQHEQYLYVFIAGDLLNGEKVGYPKRHDVL